MLFFYYLVLSTSKDPSLQSKVTDGSGWVSSVVLERNAEGDMDTWGLKTQTFWQYLEKISLKLSKKIMVVVTFQDFRDAVAW